MNNQKLSPLINLTMESTEKERNESLELNVGYEEESKRWNVIVRGLGDWSLLENERIIITPLLGNYAIVNLPQEELEEFSRRPEIEYIEKPKRLFFSVLSGRSVSCIRPLENPPWNLSGKGILVACIDSGIDYMHEDFRNPDGTTRILRLWDQTIEGNPPQGYRIGSEYTKEEINQAIQAASAQERYKIVPSKDLSGHGTAVMGIAAGNGRESQGVYHGVAPESDLLVVKLGTPLEEGFPRTTELMQGIDYAVRTAIQLGMPVVINLSFGNNYGAHSGTSLVETYINNVANLGRTTICIGTGNEGSKAGHTSGRIVTNEIREIELGIGMYEMSVNIQLWKNYQDQMDIFLENPSGRRIGPIQQIAGAQRYRLDETDLLIYYGEPSPYSTEQEIYIDFLPINKYIDSGIWKVILKGNRILEGNYDLWLPGGNVLGENTKFYQPTPERTLTIPSTALQVISVGAYNAQLQSYADFSGRGYTRTIQQIKPDLAAPGVNIISTKSGGGYAQVTGTSFATPFVSGSAALLMEWGLIKGNDMYLYGEKIKSYLIKGARQLPGEIQWPNPRLGWGVLCLRNSLPE